MIIFGSIGFIIVWLLVLQLKGIIQFFFAAVAVGFTVALGWIIIGMIWKWVLLFIVVVVALSIYPIKVSMKKEKERADEDERKRHQYAREHGYRND